MDTNNRPHSRNKTVVSGSAGVKKGQQIPSSGSINHASMPKQAPRTNRSNRASSGQTAAGAIGILGLLTLLPKSIRRILFVIIIILIALFLLRSCLGTTAGYPIEFSDANESSNSSQSQTNTTSYASLFSTEDSFTAEQVSNDSLLEDSDTLDTTVSSEARDKRVIPLGNGDDVVTLMVYMCGTDLESKYSMATADLKEMVNASLSDSVNLIVCTGGCSKWQNNVVSNNVNQIYQIQNGKLIRIVDDFGNKAMTDPVNLTNFIKYCTENYPANRNALIFWDHGGGSLSGYGYDEKNRSASSMTLDKINGALKNAGCIFDWIGFDACLMATLENALVCNEYADYLIASEETEPGTGWYYTNWLNKLSKNSSLSTVEIGKTIIDDYVAVCTRSSNGAKVTLSLIDLSELQGTVPVAFNQFALSTSDLLKSDDYQKVSNARANVRQFSASNKLNQIDLIDFADRIDTNQSQALSKALKGCVKYNGSTISKANGVSIYFPYETLKNMNSAVTVYTSLGIDSAYTDCIKNFASMESAGQITATSSQNGIGSSMFGDLLSTYANTGNSTSSPVSTLLGGSESSSLDSSSILDILSAFSGRSMPAGMEWVNTEAISDQANYISEHCIDPSRIKISEENGHNLLSLTDKEWSLIQSVELNVFIDDGTGFIDLGRDNVAQYTDNGDLLMDFDGTWLTIDGHVVAYYLESDTQNSDGSWTTVGYVPILLNNQYAKLQIVFHNNDVMPTGAYIVYDNETDTEAKGLIPLRPGDTIQPLCDYYTYDNEYTATYTLGNSFNVSNSGISIANMKLSDIEGYRSTWRLTDIYNNYYWTPSITN